MKEKNTKKESLWNALKNQGKSFDKLPDGGAVRSPLFDKIKGKSVEKTESKLVSKNDSKKEKKDKIEIKKPGALHKKMGIPEGKKIPMDDLKKEKTKAKKTGDKILMKEVVFAENFRGKKKK